MLPDDKSEFIRARVSAGTKTAFEEYAAALGKTASDQLREMIDKFIQDEAVRTNKDVVVSINQPPGYQREAWAVSIKVQNPDAVAWQGQPLGFELPALPKRRIQSDSAYIAPIVVTGGEIKLGGRFIDGLWQGHIYSNGVVEDDNPTPIEIVRDKLEEVTRELIASLETRWYPGKA